MYLKDRLPLPINVNPALVFVEDDDVMTKQPKNRKQLVRATNLLVSALRCSTYKIFSNGYAIASLKKTQNTNRNFK